MTPEGSSEMGGNRIETLERRLASAERELAAGRRWARRATGAAVTLCGAVLMAFHPPAAPPETLTVKAPFVVLDAAGRPLVVVGDTQDKRGLFVANGAGEPVAGLFSVRDGGQVKIDAPGGGAASAAMWITKEGKSRLELDGPGGVPVATLGVTDDQSQLNIFNTAGANVVTLRSQPNSGGAVTAYSSDRSSYSALGANDQGQAGVRIRSGDRILAELGESQKGHVRLKLSNPQGQPVAVVGSNPDGSGGTIIVANGTGNRLGSLEATAGGGQLSVWGAGQTPLAQVGVDGSKGMMRIYNQNGASVVWMNESAGGAGHIAVADPGGAAAAEMGYNGTGIVRALGPGGKIDFLRGPQ